MFGHDDHHENDSNNDTGQQPAPAPDGSLTHSDDEQPSGAPPAAPADTAAPDTDAGSYLTDDGSDNSPAPEPAPAPEAPAPAEEQPEPSASPEHPARSDPSDNNDLIGIKQQALQELSPLVDHLEQTPVEEFRTTMMMIQASDNSSLIKKAYDAAQRITDEKVRAQALLDIVNEINYFTSSQQS